MAAASDSVDGGGEERQWAALRGEANTASARISLTEKPLEAQGCRVCRCVRVRVAYSITVRLCALQ